MFYNRRLYPQQPKIESRQQENSKETTDILSLKKAILRSLEHLSDNIDQIKKTINTLSKKVDGIETKQTLLENQIDLESFSEYSVSRSDLLNIKSELDLLKKKFTEDSSFLEQNTHNYLNSNNDSCSESNNNNYSESNNNSYSQPNNNSYSQSNNNNYSQSNNDNIYFESNHQPIMPGSGFASITAEYLKNIKKE